jgi:hypothetical protein
MSVLSNLSPERFLCKILAVSGALRRSKPVGVVPSDLSVCRIVSWVVDPYSKISHGKHADQTSRGV